MTDRNEHGNTPEQNPSTRDWHVETIDELTEENLENALNDADQRGQTIREVIPHQIKKPDEVGRQVAVDITSTIELNNNSHRIWHVKRSDGYGSDLEKVLEQAESEGWTIFAIIPHRIGKDNFPEVIMNKPYLAD